MTAWLIALMGAVGCVLVASAVPVGRDRIASRIEPYLDRPLGRRQSGGYLRRLAVQLLPPDALLEQRLAGAASPLSPAAFRAEQLAYSAGGLVLGSLITVLSTLRSGELSPGRGVLLCALLAGAAFVLRDRILTWEVQRRTDRVASQLPLVLDLLTLAVTAGQSVQTALGHVARAASGPLAEELQRTVGDMRTGASLEQALRAFAARIPSPWIDRTVTAIVTAIETGAPIAETLRVNADEQRERARQSLLERAGRREVLMLIPVVFLILPVVVAFALYPGLVTLDLLVP